MADEENQDPPCTSGTEEEGSWWGSWGQGWIDTVKAKSALTMQMVKKDLNEFVEVIQGDTSVAISETASKIQVEESNNGGGAEAADGDEENQIEGNNFRFDSLGSATKVVRKGMVDFLKSVSELMAIPPDDSKDEEITIVDFSSTGNYYNRKQEQLHAVQIDPGTYCNEPEGLFSEWLEVFNLDDNKQHMSNMLVQNPAVRSIYTQLVPAVVSHTMFWQRYFYQLFLLDAEEKKREEIVARANDKSNDDDDAGSGWGDDDDDDDGIEVLASSTTATVMDYSIINNDIHDSVDKVSEFETVEKVDMLKLNNTELDVSTQNISNNHSEAETTENLPNEKPCGNPEKIISLANNEQTSENNDKHVHSTDEHTNSTQTDDDMPGEYESLPGGEVLEISSDIIDISCNAETESDNETIQGNIEEVKPKPQLIHQEHSETSSLSSWMSIDDVIKVKKISGDQEVKSDNNVSANVSTDSNGVLINKSDIIDESDEDFELDLEDDVNEDEVAKMVEEIKHMSAGGNVEDDDDWENWE